MSYFKSAAILLTMTTLQTGCLESYQPPVVPGDANMLVVDGFLNSVDGTVTVRLTHSIPLSPEEAAPPELGAFVTLQQDDGSSYDLQEQGEGSYVLNELTVDTGAQYRLHIRTADSQEYESALVGIKQTPPIDSLTWRATPEGIYVNVNAHDDTGLTRYYRWEFSETWQYHAEVTSEFKIVNKKPEYRRAGEFLYTCWDNQVSRKITIASTERLQQDIVSQLSLIFIPKYSNKISVKYSMLVQQWAISKEEFTFLQRLQKTTENVGSLFDPQPSQVVGNISSLTNPSSIALGYFSAGNAHQQRLFVDFYDLPDDLQKFPPSIGCQVDSVCATPLALQCVLNLSDLTGSELLGSVISREGVVVGFTLSSPNCADCRTQGGVLTKPDFWP